jgi:hypothetical protein
MSTHHQYTGASATATGSGVAILFGGVFAQAANPTVGIVGVIVASAGLVTALFGGVTQLFKLWLDYQSYSKQVEKLKADMEYAGDVHEKQVEKLSADLAESRRRRHEESDRTTSILLNQQLEIAHLKGQLGITDRLHSEGINANAENILAVAERTGTSLPNSPPRVNPVVDSDNDYFTPNDPRPEPNSPGSPHVHD